jgi:hypothetical protein
VKVNSLYHRCSVRLLSPAFRFVRRFVEVGHAHDAEADGGDLEPGREELPVNGHGHPPSPSCGLAVILRDRGRNSPSIWYVFSLTFRPLRYCRAGLCVRGMLLFQRYTECASPALIYSGWHIPSDTHQKQVQPDSSLFWR